MDYLAHLFYGGSVRKEDMVFKDIEDELEMPYVPPSFSDLFLCVKEKFDGAFTSRGEVDSGKTREHFILMPLPNEGHWSRKKRYNRRVKCDHAWLRWWWRMDTGRRMGHPLMALEAMNNNGGRCGPNTREYGIGQLVDA